MLNDEPGIAIALLRKKRDSHNGNEDANEDYMSRMESLEKRVEIIEKKMGLKTEVENDDENA